MNEATRKRVEEWDAFDREITIENEKPSIQKLCECGAKTSTGCEGQCFICHNTDLFNKTSMEVHLRAAGVPRKLSRKTPKWYLESFLNKKAYLHTEFRDSFNTSVFLYGEPGSRKTTFAVSMMIDHMIKWNTTREHYKRERTFLFTTLPEMIQNIRFSFKGTKDEEMELYEKYKNVEFLVLDDFGVEKTSDWAFSVLYLIINHRYEEDKITVFTSNFNLDQLAEKNNDERITRRLSDWCRIIELS